MVFAFLYVVEEIPDAKLLVVGGEYSSGILKKMEERIAKRELEHNVILCGYDTDIDSYPDSQFFLADQMISFAENLFAFYLPMRRTHSVARKNVIKF